MTPATDDPNAGEAERKALISADIEQCERVLHVLRRRLRGEYGKGDLDGMIVRQLVRQLVQGWV